jgi:TPR repeat protein
MYVDALDKPIASGDFSSSYCYYSIQACKDSMTSNEAITVKDRLKAQAVGKFTNDEAMALQGDAQAAANLGDSYLNGVGVGKDFVKAAGWYYKSAKMGNADGENGIGWCYREGLGVEKDLKAAVTWFRKSVDQGNAAAENNLGYCYELGWGVEKDKNRAHEFYRKSAEQGNDLGELNWARCCQTKNVSENDQAPPLPPTP